MLAWLSWENIASHLNVIELRVLRAERLLNEKQRWTKKLIVCFSARENTILAFSKYNGVKYYNREINKLLD